MWYRGSQCVARTLSCQVCLSSDLIPHCFQVVQKFYFFARVCYTRIRKAHHNHMGNSGTQSRRGLSYIALRVLLSYSIRTCVHAFLLCNPSL